MPIDFNPHFYNNIQPQQQIINPHYMIQNQLVKDTFIKNTDIKYDGILQKKLSGKLKKQEKLLLFILLLIKTVQV